MTDMTNTTGRLGGETTLNRLVLAQKPTRKKRGVACVLWGPNFDELAAATFTAMLRKRGLRVYLVGISGTTATGQHGLTLGADRTLGQAILLATHSVCIIVPCDTPSLWRAENDPRFCAFVAEAASHRARIVLSDSRALAQSRLVQIGMPTDRLTYYSPCHDLCDFADELATVLLSDMAVERGVSIAGRGS